MSLPIISFPKPVLARALLISFFAACAVLSPNGQKTHGWAAVETQVVVEQEMRVDQAFKTEKEDLEWSQRAETSWTQVFQKEGIKEELKGIQLRNIECGTTLCRVELTPTAAPQGAAAFEEDVGKLLLFAPWQGSGIVKIENPDGQAPVAMIYMAREGHTLPFFPNRLGIGQLEILIAEDNGGGIQILDPSGSLIRTIANTSFDSGGDALAVGNLALNVGIGDEILIAENNGGGIQVLNSSGSVLSTITNTSFDSGGDALAVGDLDGNGQVEILIAEDNGGGIQVLNSSGSVIRTITNTSFDGGGDALAVGDLEGDGQVEILIAEDNGGGIQVLNSLGSVIRTIANTSFDSGGDALAVGDLEGDGQVEILIAEDNGGGIQVLNSSGSVIRTIANTSFDGGGDALAVGFGLALP